MQPTTMTQLVVHFFGISLKINLCGRLRFAVPLIFPRCFLNELAAPLFYAASARCRRTNCKQKAKDTFVFCFFMGPQMPQSLP